MKNVTIYTDGACENNPGPGGWAAVLIYQSIRREIFGSVPATTNNRMELSAAIEALRVLKEPCIVDLYTDSQYVQRGMNEWLPQWKARYWRSGKKLIRNVDLWKELDANAARHQIRWHWIRGHNQQPENERCDQLAVAAIKELRRKLKPEDLAKALEVFNAAPGGLF
jgi:ribonuclease HI